MPTATSTPGHGGTFTITYIPARLHLHIFNSPMTAIAASVNMVGATVVASTTVRVRPLTSLIGSLVSYVELRAGQYVLLNDALVAVVVHQRGGRTH